MTIIKEHILNGGTQVVHRFDNDYGASVVCHSFSYGGDRGLSELAVLRFKGDEWHIDYGTPITDDVIGYLTDEGVSELLARIEALPS